MFLGYAKHSVTYRFLVYKSVVIDHNSIAEIKNVEFFEHVCPLKDNATPKQPIMIASNDM